MMAAVLGASLWMREHLFLTEPGLLLGSVSQTRAPMKETKG